MNTTRLPRLRDEPLPRARLIDALQLAHERRCIVLAAPAGAGKTALLQSWSRKARIGQVNVVWVSPRGGSLSSPLAAQCAELAPALVRTLLRSLPVSEEEALAAIAIALVRNEAVLARPLTLVFDQLHEMHDITALQGLQPLLDYCPARVQCIFASRTALPLSLGRLREHGELLELGTDDLKWNLEEARALVRSMLGDEAVARTSEWLAQTEGWSLGLYSLCRAARAGRPDQELLQDAFTFLEAEVLAPLPRAHLELFEALSAMEVFDAALAGQQGICEDMECRSLLERFAAGTGFVQRVDGTRWWRFQATLGLLLRRRFDALGAARRRRMHRRASLYFAQAGLQLEAVKQAALGGDARLAADLVERWAGPLFQDGRHDELAALVRLVPAQAAARSPLLRLWTALLALLEHRYDVCRAMLAALERDVEPGDAATWRRMRVLKGWLAVSLDDMEAATSIFPAGEVGNEDAGIDEITLAGERNVLSWIHIYRNDYQLARDMQAGAALAAAAPRGTLFGALSGRCLAGLSLALEGRMASAERIYRDVLQESQACGAACLDPAVLATGLLGETLYELNDLAGVLALQPGLPDLEQRSLPDPFLRVVLVMLRAHAVLGRLDEAMRHAAILENFARERKLDRLLSYALFERIRLSLLRQDPEAARPVWDELAGLRKSYEAGESTALGEVTMVVDRAEILLLFYRGRLELARTRVDELLGVTVRRGRRRRVAALHFQRAAIDRELGDAASSQDHALQGLKLGAHLGLVRSLVDAHPMVPQLLDAAMELHGPDEALAFHADRLRAAAGVGPLAAIELGAALRGKEIRWAPPVPRAGLSQREEQIARLLVLALPTKEIARALGLSPETVKWHLHNIYAKLGVATRYEAVTLLRKS